MRYRWSCITSIMTAAAVMAIVQPAVAQVTQINQVQIDAVNGTLDVRLTLTNDTTPQTFTARYGETVIIDLTNTQLDLPTGDRFIENNPAEGVTSIQVAPLDTNSVRITIIGQQQAPTTTLMQANGELVVSVPTANAVADQPLEEPIEEPAEAPLDDPLPATEPPDTEDTLRIVVTDEVETDYLSPETTTGTRTDASIFEIPQTIQVIPRQVLEDQQVIRLRDALRNVPNVVEGNTFGGAGEEFVIRGFSGAAILRDGFRTANNDEATFGFEETANIERVEVLSGPASILYGNIEPGGVVNLVTERPLPEFAGEVGLQLGGFEVFRPTLDVSGPITDDGDLLYRLNVAYEYGDGFRDFDTNVERVFVAPVLEWQLGDRTNLIFDLEYLGERRPFDRGIPAIGEEVADVPLDTLVGDPDDFVEVETLSLGYRLEHEFSDNLSLRNRFRYRTSDSLIRRAEISFPLGGIDEETGNVARSFLSPDSSIETFEAQTELVAEFSTGTIEHTLLLGLDLLFSDSSVTTTTAFAPSINLFDRERSNVTSPDLPLDFTLLDLDTDLYQVGLILQNQIQVTPNLTFLLGGRFDFGRQQRQSEPVFIPGLINSSGSDEEETFENFSPRVGIVYQPITPLFLYASYSQSFLPNTLTQVTVDGDFLEPETAEQFEIGAKVELLEGRLAATLSFFDITLENIAATDPDDPNFVVPIGEQNNRGIEFVVQGEVLPGWNVIASYGLLDAEIEESEDFPDGATPRNVADNTASLFTTYEIQAGNLEGLGFGLGFFFVDSRPGDDANTFELDSYFRTDAAVFYRREGLQIGLNFRNIFDVDFFESAADRRGASPGEPFTILGTISITF